MGLCFRYGVDDFSVSSLSFSVIIVDLLRGDSSLSLLPESHAGALVLSRVKAKLYSLSLSWVSKSPTVDKMWLRQK